MSTIYKQVTELLQEYAANELSLYIINANSESYLTRITVQRLNNRQDEIYREIMKACGLPIEEKDDEE